jgi:hypothetical protein
MVECDLRVRSAFDQWGNLVFTIISKCCIEHCFVRMLRKFSARLSRGFIFHVNVIAFPESVSETDQLFPETAANKCWSSIITTDHFPMAINTMEKSGTQPEMEKSTSPTQKKFSIFDVPAPLRELFARFPLQTYNANELPLSAPTRRSEYSLHVFSTAEDAKNGRPSYNPSCLKWQVRLVHILLTAIFLTHGRLSCDSQNYHFTSYLRAIMPPRPVHYLSSNPQFQIQNRISSLNLLYRATN